MKIEKIILSLITSAILLCSISNANAQWGMAGEQNTAPLTTGGKVGIGLATPVDKLDVNTTGDNSYINIRRTGITTAPYGTAGYKIGGTVVMSISGFPAYGSGTLNITNGSNMINIQGGSVNFGGIPPLSYSAGTFNFNGRAWAKELVISAYQAPGPNPFTLPANYIHAVNGNSYFNGNIAVQGSTQLNGTTEVKNTANPNLQIIAPEGTLEFGVASCNGCYSGIAVPGNSVIRTLSNGSGIPKRLILSTSTTINSGGSIDFGSDQALIMTVKDNNTVGIGTNCIPADGKLAVNGKIYATEVSVRLTNASGCFPDYVFEPDYKLAPLSEVEKYIKENKHLPEVPSAKEVDENGINVAEMDAILLKKIEELTLYMIDVKKENEEMKKENEELKVLIKALLKEKE